jgi:hypothetical protein
MTSAERTKLSGIDASANNYTHPETHSIDIITESTSYKVMTADERTKLTGIDEGANNYTHPTTHSLDIITETSTKKILTDAERNLIFLLTGATENIQGQINALFSIGNFVGVADTYADVVGIAATPTNRDLVIVLDDENKEDASTIYIYSSTTLEWEFAGYFNPELRDFLTNPLDINIETTGILSESRVPSDIARLTDIISTANLITMDDIGGYFSTTPLNVEDVLQEVGSAISDLESSISDIPNIQTAHDVSVVDAGGYFSSTPLNVEDVLQEIGSSITDINAYIESVETTVDASNVNVADIGDYFASTPLEDVLQEVGLILADFQTIFDDAIIIKSDLTLLSTSWVDDTLDSGYWIYTVSDTDVTINTVADVNIDLNSLNNANGIMSVTESFDGGYYLYSKNEINSNLTYDVRFTTQTG